jgi:hypothetical protein
VGWRLLEHLDSLTAFNCTTKIYETGRQKVLATKRKNVHAFILSEFIIPGCEAAVSKQSLRHPEGVEAEKIHGHGDCMMLPNGQPMRYNPYRFPYFYTWDENDEVIQVPKNLAQITLMADGKVIINNGAI